jgi:hypothetical protein
VEGAWVEGAEEEVGVEVDWVADWVVGEVALGAEAEAEVVSGAEAEGEVVWVAGAEGEVDWMVTEGALQMSSRRLLGGQQSSLSLEGNIVLRLARPSWSPI